MTTLAFAGAGWVTAVHGLAADGVPDLEVTCVASRTRRAAHRRAEQVDAVACDYDDLPGDADAVVVATPPALHLREAERATAAGAAALVEVPLADTLAAADRLVDAASAGAVIAYGENLVHAPAVAAAMRACRRIGELTYLEVRVAQPRPDGGGRLDPAWGGGVLFDLGAHAVALALLLAAPARVTAVSARLDAGQGLAVDDDATVELTFDGGLRAELRASWRAAAPTWMAQAASGSGAVHLELVPVPVVELNGRALRLPDVPDDLPSPQLHHLGYVGQLAALAADAEARRAPRSGAAFGRAVLDVICAAYASAASGRSEAVPYAGPRDRTPIQLWRDPARA
ncbi:MAG TPA: Gfo/Idh/MocA family oxidoreductase [Acidimicrobiales bacterium]